MENHFRMDLPIQDVVRFLMGQVAPHRSVLVGIDGGAGSGKTVFARWLAERISETMIPVSIVHTDSFCRPSAERMNHEFPLAMVSDIDWKRLRDEVIIPLRSGQAARFQLYDWPADSLKDWVTVDVGGVTIVDGVTAIRTELSDYYDLRVWFSCPRDIRVSRLLRRGDTSVAEIEHWMPSEEQYITTHTPETHAHLVVDSAADVAINDGSSWFAVRWLPPNGA